MPADIIWKQGDTGPAFREVFTKPDGSRFNIEDATVTLTLRAFTAASPLALTGTVTFPGEGEALYTPSTQDTSVAGDYMATWLVVFPSGEVRTFPTDGYLTVTIEPSLDVTGTQRLVELGEVKAHLNLPANDRVHDRKLVSLIDACTPIIEHKTGPILCRTFDEWHEGGGTYIVLRRRPATSLGTTPVLRLVACSEYLGPVEWPLKIIGSPDQGELYSCMLDEKLAMVVRRSAGGGVQPFPHQPQAVHVVYEAGQEEVPQNVRFALCEALREFYQTTQQVGKGRETVADEEESPSRSMAYLVARHALGMIEPMRRAPSIA
jgi:hypothetical protein